MAPLYRDLHSGRGTLRQVHASGWHRLLDALSPQATVAKQPLGMWLTVGAQLLEVGSQKISCKADVPRIPPAHAPQWISLADHSRQEIHLRNESRSALRWLSSCFAHVTSSAQSGRRRNCIAWPPQTPWPKALQWALAAGSALRSLSHGSQSYGT